MSPEQLKNVQNLKDEQINTIKQRDPSYKDADISCVRAIAQAAINVELFTIPLYMTSMYSIYGLHQIRSQTNDFYKERWWPGAAPASDPDNSNSEAFNLIFSVFIEEMLHLQLAANMASKIGDKPDFTSLELVNENYAWICYNSTIIPHILDFQDCKEPYKNIKVKLGALSLEQNELFIAIEETKDDAEAHLEHDALSKYFPSAPFDWWKTDMNETDLPLFGTIGWMYTCFWDYLEIEYTDGTNLLKILTSPDSVAGQKDEFNTPEPKEYPGIDATIIDTEELKLQFLNMIDSITDQGEGKGVAETLKRRWNLPVLKAVQKQFQPDPVALKKKYPGYDGQISGQAEARISAGAIDHLEVFQEVKKIIPNEDFQTWDMWHQIPSNKWTADMLNPSGKQSAYNIPSAKDVADALNDLKANNAEQNYNILSQAAVGTIKGITSQLDGYWVGDVKQFPSPAMYGSGDRISICWAILGKVPKLWEDLEPTPKGQLNHACQGMDLDQPPSPEDTCAGVEIYHSCKGSNGCKTEGGCGFVQNSEGGGNCSQLTQKAESGCGLQLMSAPANNKCGGSGGCAVPISASQLYPKPSSGGSFVMQLFNYGPAPNFETEKLTEMSYKEGEAVYDVAWRAYTEVMKARYPDKPAPEKPQTSDLRLAFPPST